MIEMYKKGTSLDFDEIKKKKWHHLFFWEIKNKNANLPASSVFPKSGLRNTCLFFSLHGGGNRVCICGDRILYLLC